ncbi:MAG: hypothetical protein HKN68_03365 [Saprospiraceae bacterium]|nr:hypothetical protein [Saprospiraceae bacterium]
MEIKLLNIRFKFYSFVRSLTGKKKENSIFCKDRCGCNRSIYEKNNHSDSGNESIACNLTDKKLAQRIIALKAEVFIQLKSCHEIETGYVFSFPYEENFFRKLNEYIMTEMKCCPFFVFETKVETDHDLQLKITGPPESKKLIKLFLEEL